jgi:poly(3-hydroxybutyrate) depolymerase
MPLNLATFGINKASEVIDAFPQIVRWVIGGHSVGGAMAARFVANNPSVLEGLVLWSSHPASDNDLSNRDLVTVSIYETLNGLSINRNIDSTHHLLPPQTRWVPIEGGTHAQFGWYGPQKGENVATISQKDQQKIIINATLDLLMLLGN